jgi:hypothetical protein
MTMADEGIPPLPGEPAPQWEDPGPVQQQQIYLNVPFETVNDNELSSVVLLAELRQVMGLDIEQWRRVLRYHLGRAEETINPRFSVRHNGLPISPSSGVDVSGVRTSRAMPAANPPYDQEQQP